MIRRAQAKDIPAMLELLRQVNLVHVNGRPDIFIETTKFGPEDLEISLQDPNKITFVYEDGGEVLGYAITELRETGDNAVLRDIKTLYIEDICVDESARGRHVGTELYREVEAFAKEEGCYHITLNVWEFNESAKKFYQEMGLKPMHTILEKILEQI